MNNYLYPLKFSPIYKTKIWGGNRFLELLGREGIPKLCGESWEICDFSENISIVKNGLLKGTSLKKLIEKFKGDLVGNTVYEKYGDTFPLLVKFIDAADDLSVQVHPEDKLALQRHNSLGKSEMWYIIDCNTDAQLVSGLKKNVTKESYIKAVTQGNLHSLLQYYPTQKGDCFFIPAGCVHAIGKGNLILEIQQASDVTYRIYDYDRCDNNGCFRELHTENALEAINFTFCENKAINFCHPKNSIANIVDCNYFTINLIELSQIIERNYYDIDSFVILVCVEGKCLLSFNSTEQILLSLGESILIPSKLKNLLVQPLDDAKVIESYVKIK